MKIMTPNGGTREVDALNPGDIAADGTTSPLDLISDAGPAASGPPLPEQLNPGADETSPAAAVPVLRKTTQPRWIAPVTRPRDTTKF